MFWMLLKVLGAVAAAATVVGIAGVIYDTIHEKITESTIREDWLKRQGNTIQENLDNNNFNEVHCLTTAKVTDVSRKDGETYVAYECNGEKYGLRSDEGTSLTEGDVIII